MREASLYRGCCCCFLGPVLLKVQLLRGLWGERGLQARPGRLLLGLLAMVLPLGVGLIQD